MTNLTNKQTGREQLKSLINAKATTPEEKKNLFEQRKNMVERICKEIKNEPEVGPTLKSTFLGTGAFVSAGLFSSHYLSSPNDFSGKHLLIASLLSAPVVLYTIGKEWYNSYKEHKIATKDYVYETYQIENGNWRAQHLYKMLDDFVNNKELNKRDLSEVYDSRYSDVVLLLASMNNVNARKVRYLKYLEDNVWPNEWQKNFEN